LSEFAKLIDDFTWKNRYSVTKLGRRRYFDKKELFADGKEFMKFKSKICRESFNHIIQGTGADIIKLAMCRIYYENPFGDALKIILQVHDELGFYIRKDIIEPAKAFIEKCMLEEEQKFLGRIPAAVESKVAEFWCH
jgi:DNA polymerase I-like protein with 3'-5' exonuclease and polymerase domains